MNSAGLAGRLAGPCTSAPDALDTLSPPIEMAHALGIATIGEYGHDVAVVDRLRHLGVKNVKLENGNS